MLCHLNISEDLKKLYSKLSTEVNEYLAELDAPLYDQVELVRKVILSDNYINIFVSMRDLEIEIMYDIIVRHLSQ
jgi:hypothetical protein